MHFNYRAHIPIILFLMISIIIVYSNSLNVPFLFDDYSSIKSQSVLFESDLGALYNRFEIRILAYMTFKANYLVHGLHVQGYHIVNIFVHCLTVLTIYMLAFNLYFYRQKDTSNSYRNALIFAGIAAGIFALHPLHTQAVSYIVQRIAALAALFYLSSMLAYFKYRTSEITLYRFLFAGLALTLAICAFLTKQNTFTLPIAILLLEIIVLRRKSQKSYGLLPIMYVALGAAGIICLLIFMPNVIDQILRLTQETTDFTRAQYFETQLSVILLYVKLFVFPINQQVEYIYILADGTFKHSIHYLIMYLLVIAFAIGQAKKSPLISFSILFYFASHIVESGAVPISDLVFEHRTYLPNFGLCLITAWCLSKMIQKKFLTGVIVTSCIFIILASLTYARNQQWADPEQLYNAELLVNNDKPRIHAFLGKLYANQGKHHLAVESYQQAFELAGKFDSLDNQGFNDKFSYLNNYIGAMREINMTDKAIEIASTNLQYVTRAEHLGPIYSNLGFLNLDKKQYQQCISYMMKAMNVAPSMAEPFVGGAVCFNATNNTPMAIFMFKRALQLEPNSQRVISTIKDAGLGYIIQ